MIDFFEKAFKNLKVPVIVCKLEDGYPLVFANTSARLLCNPLLTLDDLKEKDYQESIDDFLIFQKKASRETFLNTVNSNTVLSGFKVSLITAENQEFTAYLAANTVSFGDENYFITYVNEDSHGTLSIDDIKNTVSTAYQIALKTHNKDEAINKILALIGTYADVSRAYILEDLSPTTTGNTYEWCNTGVTPAIDRLKCIEKDEFNYEEIIESGIYKAEDVRDLPDTDRGVLEAQNIKSMLAIALYGPNNPIGYIAFDDVFSYRNWSKSEVQLLRDVSNLIVALISSRKSMNLNKRNEELIQTVLDRFDEAIYVNDIESYDLIFTNQKFDDSLSRSKNDIIGKKCYYVIQGFDSPCDFCPLPEMKKEGEERGGQTHTWDFKGRRTGKWYKNKDSISPWIDNRPVHIVCATEITNNKVYEEQIEYFSSTDLLTGLRNRDSAYEFMGNHIISHELSENPEYTLVYVDIDDLKKTSKEFGYDTGENMLIEMANIIRSNIRIDDLVFKWGGDEYLIFLKNIDENSESIIQRIQAALDEFNNKYDLPYVLSFSYGMTDFDATSVEEIDATVERAADSMREQKQTKKNLKKDFF